MTCVCGFVAPKQYGQPSSVLMCADSRVTGGDSQATLVYPKILIRDDLMIGFAGTLKDIQMFQHLRYELKKSPLLSDMAYLHNLLTEILPGAVYSNPLNRGEKEEGDDRKFLELFLLIGYRGNIYTVDPFLCITPRSTDYTTNRVFEAIGSGSVAAEGAWQAYETCTGILSEAENLKNIIECVSKVHPSVGFPVCSVNQTYDPSTQKTSYTILDTYAPLDIVVSSDFEFPVEVKYEEPLYERENFIHIPLAGSGTSKKPKRRVSLVKKNGAEE